MRWSLLFLLPLSLLFSEQSEFDLWGGNEKALLQASLGNLSPVIEKEAALMQSEFLRNNRSLSLPLDFSARAVENISTQADPQFQGQWDITLRLLQPGIKDNRELEQRRVSQAEHALSWERQQQLFLILQLCQKRERERELLALEKQAQQALEGQIEAMEVLAARSRVTRSELQTAHSRLYRRRSSLYLQEQRFFDADRLLIPLFGEDRDQLCSGLDWSSMNQAIPLDEPGLPHDRPDLLHLMGTVVESEFKSNAGRRLYLPDVRIAGGMSGIPDNSQWNIDLTIRYSLDQLTEGAEQVELLSMHADSLRIQIDSEKEKAQLLLSSTWKSLFFLRQALESQKLAEDLSFNALQGLDQEFQAGLTTSQDYLAALSNHRILASEMIVAKWALYEAELYLLLLMGALDI